MAKTASVRLSRPVITHDGKVDTLTLREPKGSDYFALGEPFVIARNQDGTLYTVENVLTIEAYARRCIQSPGTAATLDDLTLADAHAVKAAVLDFFTEARQASLPPSSTSSSST